MKPASIDRLRGSYIAASLIALALLAVALFLALQPRDAEGYSSRTFNLGYGKCDHRITFQGRTVNADGTTTWSYQLENLDHCDTKYWVLEMCNPKSGASVYDAFVSAWPNGYRTDKDGNYSTGIVGVKWTVDKGFKSGKFSLKLSQDFLIDSNVDLGIKVGKSSVVDGTIEGPKCKKPPSDTPTKTATKTDTPPKSTKTPTKTATATATKTATDTATKTVTSTATNTATRTATNTATVTRTPTATPTETLPEITPFGTPQTPVAEKGPRLQNLFLTSQGPNLQPSSCQASTDVATFAHNLTDPITTLDPKNGQLQQLGGFEFQVTFDGKMVCVNIEPGPATANMECTIFDKDSSSLENSASIHCLSKGKGNAPDTTTAQGRLLAFVHVRPQPDAYKFLIANQENGFVVPLINQNCQLADDQGHPIALRGCDDAYVTLRFLEGDVHADCVVDVLDQQQIAFRWGAQSGQLLYNDRLDVEPSSPLKGDGDIDSKDLQFVYGRHGSRCSDPHPPQPAVDPTLKE
jgi:hypothetical protein